MSDIELGLYFKQTNDANLLEGGAEEVKEKSKVDYFETGVWYVKEDNENEDDEDEEEGAKKQLDEKS